VQRPRERKVVDLSQQLRDGEPRLRYDSQLDYNLACYKANTNEAKGVAEALEILKRYLAFNPDARTLVLQDPDLLDVTEIATFFRSGSFAQEAVPGSSIPPACCSAESGWHITKWLCRLFCR